MSHGTASTVSCVVQLSRRMFGEIEVNDTATLVAKDDEDEQNFEGCGGQRREKIERHQVLCMISRESSVKYGTLASAGVALYLETAAWVFRDT